MREIIVLGRPNVRPRERPSPQTRKGPLLQSVCSFTPLSPTVTSMQLALETYDIVNGIASWLSVTDLSSTIRVNKLWFNASKRHLWGKVKLRDALRLLGTVETFGTSPHSSNDSVDIHKWKRFYLYSWHIHGLNAVHTDSTALFHAIKSRSSLPKNFNESDYLFPACQGLTWVSEGARIEIQVLDALITPNVHSISLLAKAKTKPIWFSNFCNLLIARLSRLQTLFIDYKRNPAKLDHLTPLHELLRKFAPTLRRVRLSGTQFAQMTALCLLEIDNLELLEIIDPDYDTLGHITNRVVGASNRTRDSPLELTRLEYLEIYALEPFVHQFSMLNCFRQLYLPALTYLAWRIEEVEIDMDSFLTRLPTVCPNLQRLILGNFRGRQTYTVQWSSIQSLPLKCKKLDSLSLCCLQAEMTLGNLTEFLKSCGGSEGWKTVQLFNVEPFGLSEVLSAYAEYAPNTICIGFNVREERSIHPISGTLPSAYLPSYLTETKGDFSLYLEAHRELTRNVRQNGVFFPCLEFINFGCRTFTSDLIGAVASLCLAISDHPVSVIFQDLMYGHLIHDHMIRFYVETRKLTKQSINNESIVQFLKLHHYNH